MRVLFVAAEATPLAKVGGLGDVVGSLPKALNSRGHDVRVMMPGYGTIDYSRYPMMQVLGRFNLRFMNTRRTVALKATNLADNVTVYMVENRGLFDSDDVYGGDVLKRFFLFCRAVNEILPKLDWQPEVVHCHDWHTGLIPLWFKRIKSRYASVYTIHNLAYQGPFDDAFFSGSGLSKVWWPLPAGSPNPPLNCMSQGILWADMVTTVSENYAREILTPDYGVGLDHLLRYRQEQLVGIVNGLDYEDYSPISDSRIIVNYDASKLDSKFANKLVLQKRAGLPEAVNVPLIGMVSRLDEQKGLDIVGEGLEFLIESTQAQLVFLGVGKERYEALLQQAAVKYPSQMAAFVQFDETLARQIYAGCDIFLMPSRFEPCGLGQLIAMRYGTVPVVHRTGGLADTVQNLTDDLEQGSGFVFDEYSSEAMLAAILRAVTTYKNKESWRKVVQRIMALDYSWQSSAMKYETVYHKAWEMVGHART